jgi:hypothetical protein
MNTCIGVTRVRLAIVPVCLLLGAVTIGAQDQTRPPGAAQTNITVHGRWAIEVREPNGVLVARHEFENALSPTNGQRVLAGLLGRFYRHIPQWTVRFSGPPVGTCDAGVVGCLLREHLGAGPAPIGAIQVNVPNFSPTGNPNDLIPSNGTVELVGIARFSLAGSIQSVGTELSLCREATCTQSAQHFYPFTTHVLTTPINVSANQIVQVTVVLSFS